jgi:hypothetical protein
MKSVAANAIQFIHASPVATFNPTIADVALENGTVDTNARTPISSRTATIASPSMHSQTRSEKLESQSIKAAISRVLVRG